MICFQAPLGVFDKPGLGVEIRLRRHCRYDELLDCGGGTLFFKQGQEECHTLELQVCVSITAVEKNKHLQEQKQKLKQQFVCDQ